MYDHCPLQSVCATYNSSILTFHVHVVFTSRAVVHLASLGHTCYLELARGFTYTLHVSSPRGGPRAIPEVLEYPPCPSYILSRHICCLSWKRVRHLLHAGDFPGLPRFPLVGCLLHVIYQKDPHNTVIIPAVEDHPEVAMLVHHSVLICPRMCNVLIVFVPHMKSKGR